MKHMRWICALALIAALLLALPALAEEGTGIVDPIGEETSEATCPESDTGVHQIPDDAWVISVEPSCMVGLRKGPLQPSAAWSTTRSSAPTTYTSGTRAR